MIKIRYLVVAVTAAAALTLSATGRTAASAAPDDPIADEAVVQTTSGWVRGDVAGDHRVFRGIPYAAPPVGELRWRYPRPVASWSDIRDAIRPGSACPQVDGGFTGDFGGGTPEVVGTEDCLYLNVTTPHEDIQTVRRAAMEQPAAPLPVLVYLHGGGFINGSGDQYDPTELVVRGNVIVVTVNYRLGALGFLAHPALLDAYNGNFGLADQQAALRWVRQNIAAFGGDPRNVTLWGQSAGAFSVCAQLAAPGASGLFQRAIVQSGPCGNAFVTRQVAEKRGLATAAARGCDNPRTAAGCLRRLPVEDLVGINDSQVYLVHPHLSDLPWQPVAGTPALPLQPLTALRLGATPAVPILQGGTKDEMRMFVALSYDVPGRPVTEAEYPNRIGQLFGAAHADAILRAYPLSSYPSPGLAMAAVLTDSGGLLGTCSQLPADDAAARRAPVYSYEFAEATGDALGGLPLGASHGSDLRFLFPSLQWPKPDPLSPTERVLSERLIDYWTAFARTGSPDPYWPSYRSGAALSLATDRIAPVDVASEHQCAFWRSHQ